jgi:hypothetical protein
LRQALSPSYIGRDLATLRQYIKKGKKFML